MPAGASKLAEPGPLGSSTSIYKTMYRTTYTTALFTSLCPAKFLDEWAAKDFPMPDRNFSYRGVDASGKLLKAIPYKELDLNLPRQSFDIAHELTNKGIQKFVADYQSTLQTLRVEFADLLETFLPCRWRSFAQLEELCYTS